MILQDLQHTLHTLQFMISSTLLHELALPDKALLCSGARCFLPGHQSLSPNALESVSHRTDRESIRSTRNSPFYTNALSVQGESLKPHQGVDYGSSSRNNRIRSRYNGTDMARGCCTRFWKPCLFYFCILEFWKYFMDQTRMARTSEAVVKMKPRP